MKFQTKSILDVVFPIQCLGCQTYGTWVCDRCFKSFTITDGYSLARGCKHSALEKLWVVSSLQQPLLAQAIHYFKYQGIADLDTILGALLVRFLRQYERRHPGIHFEHVMGVPLSERRRRWRGYNQADLLAAYTSRICGWPHTNNIVVRSHQLLPQVGLSAQDRLAHVQNIFQCVPSPGIRGAKILLIDDVVTTGATMNECAKALRKNGAGFVWGLAVARG